MKTAKNSAYRQPFPRFPRHGAQKDAAENGYRKPVDTFAKRDFETKTPKEHKESNASPKFKGRGRGRQPMKPEKSGDTFDDSDNFFASHSFDENAARPRSDRATTAFQPPAYPQETRSFRSVNEYPMKDIPHPRKHAEDPKSDSAAKAQPATPPADQAQPFEDYLDNYCMKDIEKTVLRSNTACLDSTVIGIDARYWLRRLEPNRKALFTFSQRPELKDAKLLTKHMMLQELLRFRDLSMTVLLVLHGMDYSVGKDAAQSTATKGQLADGRQRIAQHTNAPTDYFSSEFALNELLEICWEYRSSILSHVRCVRAPSDALAQLSYYAQAAVVDHVFGPPWLFWVDTPVPERIIIDIVDQTIFYTEKTSQIAAITDASTAEAMLLQSDGHVRGLAKAQAIPTESMFLHLTLGLLSPSLLDAAVTLRVVDVKPAYDSREIRQVFESILPLRTQMIRMLLKNQRKHTHVQWVRGHGEGKPTVIALPPAIELDEWELEGVDCSQPPSFVGAVDFISHKAYTRNPYTAMTQYSYALHLKYLDFLGYFVHRDIRKGRQMFPRCERGVFGEALAHTHPIFAQGMVLLIELVRTKSLSWGQLQNAKSFSFFQNPFFTEAHRGEEMEATLLARLFSFVPVDFEDDSLTHADVASDDLKAFWEVLQAFRSTLLQVSEVISVVELPLVEFREGLIHEAFGYLPFKRVVSPALGAVMEHLVVVAQSAPFQKQSKEAKLQYLKSKFPQIKNLPYSLTVGFQWVDEVLRAMQHLFDYMEDEEPQSTKEYICRLVFVLRRTKFLAEKVKLLIFD